MGDIVTNRGRRNSYENLLHSPAVLTEHSSSASHSRRTSLRRLDTASRIDSLATPPEFSPAKMQQALSEALRSAFASTDASLREGNDSDSIVESSSDALVSSRNSSSDNDFSLRDSPVKIAERARPATQTVSAAAGKPSYPLRPQTVAAEIQYESVWKAYQPVRLAGRARHGWNFAAGMVNYLPFWFGSACLALTGSAVAALFATSVVWTLTPPLAERFRDTLWSSPHDELLRVARDIDVLRVHEYFRGLFSETPRRDVGEELLTRLSPAQRAALGSPGMLFLRKMASDDATCFPSYGGMATLRASIEFQFPEIFRSKDSIHILIQLSSRLISGLISGGLFSEFTQLARRSQAITRAEAGLTHLAGVESVMPDAKIWALKCAHLELKLADIDSAINEARDRIDTAQVIRERHRARLRRLEQERGELAGNVALAKARSGHFSSWIHDLKTMFSCERLPGTLTTFAGRSLSLISQALLNAYPMSATGQAAPVRWLVEAMLPAIEPVFPTGFWSRNEYMHLVNVIVAMVQGAYAGIRERHADLDALPDIESGREPGEEEGLRVRFETGGKAAPGNTTPTPKSRRRVRGNIEEYDPELTEDPVSSSGKRSVSQVAASDTTASRSRQQSRRGSRAVTPPSALQERSVRFKTSASAVPAVSSVSSMSPLTSLTPMPSPPPSPSRRPNRSNISNRPAQPLLSRPPRAVERRAATRTRTTVVPQTTRESSDDE
jgi:hypothetical protein